MRLLSILVLVTGFSTLAWIAEHRGAYASTPTEDLPTREFELPGLPHGDAEVRRILQKWAVRHYVERHEDYRIDWEIQGDAVASDANEDAWIVRPCVVFYEYPKTGNEAPSTVVFQGESARYAKATKAVHFSGSVETHTSDGSELTAEELDSTLDKKELRTDGKVHLRRAGLDLRGTGYQSDSQLNHIVFQRDVKAELSAAGGPSLPRPRGETRKTPVKTSLSSTVITCGQGMVFEKTSAKGETGPIRSHASFAGGVQLLRDVPGGTGLRLTCDSLETFLVEDKREGKGGRTTLEKLVARGHVHIEDVEGAMECDLLLVERKSPTLEVLTLSGPLQRLSVRKAGSLAPMSSAPAEGAPPAQGPMEAGCLGPIVIEREGTGRRGHSKVFLSQGVTLAQSGSLVQSDEMDLLLTPPEKGGQAEMSSFQARGHVFLASEAKVALAEKLDWDREKGVTRLTGGTGVEVVEADRRIHALELTLTQAQKGEKVLATGGVRIEMQDLTASGAQLDADPSQDRMVIVGPPDVTVVQSGSTIRCKRFTLRHDERRMMAEDDVRIHFVDDPANKGNTKSLAPVLPGATPKPGEKREGDLSCDYQEFSWKEDGGMDRMVSAGHVVVTSAGTRAEGRTFDWNATKGEGVIEAEPYAVATTTPQKEGGDPATFRGRRIRFTSAGRLILAGPKQVEMVREVEDAQGKKTKEAVTAVCERDLVVVEGGKEIHLEKEVLVRSGTTSIRCDSMRVFADTETNEIKRLLAWGNIRYRAEERIAFAKQMEWEPGTQATDLRSLPPAVMVDADGRLLYAEHISITNHGKNEVAENEYRRRNIWLPGEKKK